MAYVIKQINHYTKQITIEEDGKTRVIDMPDEHQTPEQKQSYLQGHQNAHKVKSKTKQLYKKIIIIQTIIILLLIVKVIHG